MALQIGGLPASAGPKRAIRVAAFEEELVVIVPVPTKHYLSDLDWTSATNGWGPVERDRANGSKNAADGKGLSLRGEKFAKGLGVNSPSTIDYALASGSGTFHAVVGIDRRRGAQRRKRSLHRPGRRRRGLRQPGPEGRWDVERISVPVTGGKTLTLVVDDGGDSTANDHADRADAHLMCTD